MDRLIDIESCLYVHTGQTRPVLCIDEFLAQKGEQISLTGASGSGKTTLLHLLAGLMDPSSGSIKINGTQIHRLKGSKRDRFRGREIGMVFQTFNLLQGFSASENVMAAMMFSDQPKSSHRVRAQELLSSLDMDKYDQSIEKLSVGQQQRVAIARAIACSPSVVLADEPTASLDPDRAQGAMSLLQSACRSINATLICVTHDQRLVSGFDRVERLEDINTVMRGNDVTH